MSSLLTIAGQQTLLDCYRTTLLADVAPFWLKHSLDREHGGFMTAVDRDGSLLDTDKSIWFQGRGAWMYSTLYHTVEQRPEWLAAAQSAISFIEQHAVAPNGKLYFTTTRTGEPLRMRRYVYSESFAAIANGTISLCSHDPMAAERAAHYFQNYLDYSFTPGKIPPKTDTTTRPMRGIGPLMIAIVTAQELRPVLGEKPVFGRTCTAWIDYCIAEIREIFWKPDRAVLLETAGPHGEIIDHFDGRQLNPGHAIECAWFILHEGKLRSDQALIDLGLAILDAMWARGWDQKYGGLFYFRDLDDKPVQEYWHDMKFWWPHNEAIIATLLAWDLTGDAKYAKWHQQIHEWSFEHFADREHGEWYGYLHRDGSVSVPLKGNMWKGPFHLPRMLWYCWQLLDKKIKG